MYTYAERISQFWAKFGYYDVPYEKLLEAINKHLNYGTIEVIEKEGEILAIARYNIVGDTAIVLDAVVKPEFTFKNLLKLMIINGLKKWKVEYMEFERGLKERGSRRYMISKFIGVRK